MKITATVLLFFTSTLLAYEVKIEKGPSLDAGPNTFIVDTKKVEDGTPLLEFLGGKEKIEKILIGIPHMNKGQRVFNEALVRKRFDESVSIHSKKEAWHFAPYTMGTIYWKDGRKQNFEMMLSGISVDGYLFALPPK